MKNVDWDVVGGVLALLLVIGMVAFALVGTGYELGKSRMQREAIKQGVAEFNSQTGGWQWKEDPRKATP